MNGIRIMALLALGGLSACGGGGGGDDGGVDVPLTGFDALDAEAAGFVTSGVLSDAATAADMPSTGSAEYTGVMALGQPSTVENPQDVLEDAAILGELTMTADFTRDTISGSAEDFFTSDGDALDGRLTIGEGRVNGASFSNAPLTGTLENDGTTTTYEGEVDGRFYGTRGSTLFGEVDTFATTDGETERVRGAVVAD